MIFIKSCDTSTSVNKIMSLNLIPAYGRDYKSKKMVIESFVNNMDFIISDFSSRWNGKPVNISQLIGIKKMVQIRYSNLRKVVVLYIPKNIQDTIREVK